MDDDPDVLESMCIVLESAGYDVRTATDGEEALNRLRRGEAPFLILLDLMMPKMDGWQFMAELKQDPSLTAIPVIAVSAGACRAEEMKSLGVAGYLKKPFNIQTLFSTIERYCV